jgi:hypothetical protein
VHRSGPWIDLLADARLAPSPHNTQPWLLRVVSDREAELLYDPARLLPVTDPAGRFMSCALGIFAEALSIAAAARGLEVGCDYSGNPPRAEEAAEPLARLTLREGVVDAATIELLRRRRTSRLPYDGLPVPDDVLASLARVAAPWGHAAGFSSDPSTVSWLVGLNCDTLFYDLDNDGARAEIGRWIRTSDSEARRTADGFAPSALGFPGPLVGLFFFRHGLFRPRAARAIARRLYLRTMRGTATVGWLRGPFRTPTDCFASGRMLLRFWLELTRHGLVLHPFGSVITNERAHARLAERLALEEGERELWLVLRLGRSVEPPSSSRLPTERLLA